jgi:hypothetical protein
MLHALVTEAGGEFWPISATCREEKPDETEQLVRRIRPQQNRQCETGKNFLIRRSLPEEFHLGRWKDECVHNSSMK